jgi:hypothetical protein
MLLVLLTAVSSGQDARYSIQKEIEHVQQSLKEKPIDTPFAPHISSRIDSELKDAATGLSAGQLYLSLQMLGMAEDHLQGARTLTDKAPTIKEDLTAFEDAWGKASVELTGLDNRARQRDWSRAPAALRAISEAAEQRAIPLLDASRGFAVSTKPSDGLFYLGEAEAESRFASFVFSLRMPREVAALKLRSFLPEIQRLQQKANSAFKPPISIDQHSRFIALNSTLKLAAELDANRAYAGALFEYLEATRHYAMLDATPPDPHKQAELGNAVVVAFNKLKASGRDDSIAEIFLESAQSKMVHADGSVPTADELRSVQVILDQVLPAYYAALQPPTSFQAPAGKAIEITLVRWPYT